MLYGYFFRGSNPEQILYLQLSYIINDNDGYEKVQLVVIKK